MAAWSYSSIKTFDQCPKKYYHLKVAKDVKDKQNAAALYGEQAHKAAEDYVAVGKPIEPKFDCIKGVAEILNAMPGEKFPELKLGVRRLAPGEYEPCDFKDPGVWWRGIADLVIVEGEQAKLVDYKTGKNARYADTKQLDLLAGALFVLKPEVKVIKSALAFVVSNDFISKTHTADMRDSYLGVFDKELDALAAAHETGVWNPKSGPLCGWCPVVSCPHHRERY
jgi:hypothetical protein